MDESREIGPREVSESIAAGDDLLLLDCREQVEVDYCVLDGAVVVPMSELARRLGELADKQTDRIVVYCHHGIRSMQVTHWLADKGFRQVRSMRGGIDAWTTEVDGGVPRYVLTPIGLTPLEPPADDPV